MFDAVKDKAVLLMEFDQHWMKKQDPQKTVKLSTMPAVQLLVKNTEAMKVRLLGKKITGMKGVVWWWDGNTSDFLTLTSL